MSTALRGAYWVVDLARRRPDLSVPDGYSIAEARVADADALAEATGLCDTVARERFGRGDRCWAAWWLAPCGVDEVAAWCWMSTGAHFDGPVGCRLALEADECYGWGAGVHRDHRGRRLFARLLQHVGAQMRREGHRYQWGGIEDRNAGSRRANIEAGFVPVLHVVRELGEVRTVPVVYADPALVERAHRMLGVPDPTSPLAPAAARTGPAPLPGWPAP